MKIRNSGILLHITSLPGKEGIGTLGRNALDFIDFLADTNQQLWQILPLGPVGYGNSPYLCYSAFAGNPLLIDLFLLREEGLLSENDLDSLPRFDIRQTEFSRVEKWKVPLLKKASRNFTGNDWSLLADEYDTFTDQNGWWLNDYSLFMAAKAHFGGISWQGWPNGLKFREVASMDHYREKLHAEIEFHKVLQFFFFRQWHRVREYARDKGISIIGDMPLYVGGDSADVWANTGIFMLDGELHPTHVGGVPPDYFSETGQLWGNPVFDWEKLRRQDYHWWIARIHFSLRMFDIVRIDHFRGLESFWAVPASAETAIHGEWLPAYGSEMLQLLRNQIGDLPLIAEDLGLITPEVDRLRQQFSLPGMKVLHFAFGSHPQNDHLPHNFDTNCLVYTGTHDNDTTWGWLHALSREEKKLVMSFLKMYDRKPVWALTEMAWSSVARHALIPMQDLLELGAEARMNIPGFAHGNWGWRFRWNQVRGRHRRFLSEITARYNRDQR
jgi:4-alpha-glucanotransferase